MNLAAKRLAKGSGNLKPSSRFLKHIRMIIFNFVCLRDAMLTKRFFEQLPKTAVCIDYAAVSNKLAKNDYSGEEPSDDVITSYLIKSLHTAVSGRHSGEIYYTISGTNDYIMESIKAFLEEATESQITYRLYCTRTVANATTSVVPHEIAIIYEEA